jgi:glycosyltransferase involved in cell wall biosynthesis
VAPSICFVVDGPAAPPAARLLSGLGWKVHVLDCGRAGAEEVPPPFAVPALLPAPAADRSDRIRHALERLHRARHFDLIEFPARGGLAVRSLQARQAGLAFEGVGLIVNLQACGQQQRDRAGQWPGDLEELQVDFLERHAFETADAQVAAGRSLLDYVSRIGWSVRPDAVAVSDDAALVARIYGNLLRRRPRPDILPARPLVTVAVPHYNHGRYLPETLASLAAQTYANLEVLVIDDGSTEAASLETFRRMQSRYPQFRFLTQPNAGPCAARNRALRDAAGLYFVPVDADNVARPNMVERFVEAMRRDPGAGALTCYYLAFRETADLTAGRFAYAYRPTGGPHVLASLRNVYGDTTAVYRTDAFRAVGGHETDRGTGFEDWEAFVKLVHAGHRVGVIPEYLFYYRHLPASFTRVTDDYRNRQRVLRQFSRLDALPAAERVMLWTALAGLQHRVEEFAARDRLLVYRLAHRLHALGERAPRAKRCLKAVLGFLSGLLS